MEVYKKRVHHENVLMGYPAIRMLAFHHRVVGKKERFEAWEAATGEKFLALADGKANDNKLKKCNDIYSKVYAGDTR